MILRNTLIVAIVATTIAAAAWSALAGPARGQDNDFPSQPITIVVTFPPGGGTDILARRLGAALQQESGQSVIIENRPGASGNIGARAVAHAAPDGYTLLMVNSSFAINPGVYKNLGFSPKSDLTGVINVASVPSVFVTPAQSPYTSLQGMLATGRAAGKPIMYASCGNGTPQHLAGEILSRASGVAFEQVPYRGCGPALNDLLAGQIGLGIVAASGAAPLLASGMLRALAVTAPQRSGLMSDVPTVAEQGIPGYQIDQWYGLLAPAHTPDRIVGVLNRLLAGILTRPDMQRSLQKLGFNPATSTPSEFQAVISADIDRFGELTRQIGLQID